MTKATPLSLDDFSGFLRHPAFPDFRAVDAVAVGVSGGPDSLALAHMLVHWSDVHDGPEVHVLSVDHGLRPEAAEEAAQVGAAVKDWPRVCHAVLTWEGKKPASRLQEAARDARYDLMEDYCRAHGLRYVFLAHHRDDQAETFLFRLAKGSGLDGLACMQAMQVRGGVTLVRPLLSVSKPELVAYCTAQGLSYCEDPSNLSDRFARIRLRRSMEVLEAEGLSAGRLARTAERLGRAREALEFYAERAYQSCHVFSDPVRVVFNFDALMLEPRESVFRVVCLALRHFCDEEDFGPRMLKTEGLVDDLLRGGAFRKRTLGGVVVYRDTREGVLVFEKEGA